MDLKKSPSSALGLFTRISTQDTSYVHRYGPTSAKTRFDIEPGMIQTGNHAFYIGKIFPEDWRDVISQARGKGKTHDENIYSKPFIKGILNFLAKCKLDGTIAKIVICRGLGELFNGTEDLQGAFSTEQAKEYIYDIANSFGFTKENLQVVSMEEEHASIFAALQGKKNADTGLVDGEKVYTEHTPGALDPNSADLALDIATLLQREIGTNFELKAKIEATVPDKENLQDEEKTERSYYGLTEIAIRLADLIRGRVFQGGHMRQKVYDEVIRYIYTRKGGSDSLNPIYDLIKDKDFGRLYIHEAENPFEKKSKQLIERVKHLVLAALIVVPSAGVSALTSAYVSKKHTEQYQKQIEGDIRKASEGMRHDFMHSPERLSITGKLLLLESQAILEEYYGVPSGISRELAHDFVGYVFASRELASHYSYYGCFRGDLHTQAAIAGFLKTKSLYFTGKGIDKPKHFLEESQEVMPYLARALTQPFAFFDALDGKAGHGDSGSLDIKSLQKVGKILHHEGIGTGLESSSTSHDIEKYDKRIQHENLYTALVNGQPFIVYGPVRRDGQSSAYVSASILAEECLNSSITHQLPELYREYQMIYDLGATRGKEYTNNLSVSDIRDDMKILSFVHPFDTTVRYELVFYKPGPKDDYNGFGSHCILARRQGEANFTSERAREFINRFERAFPKECGY